MTGRAFFVVRIRSGFGFLLVIELQRVSLDDVRFDDAVPVLNMAAGAIGARRFLLAVMTIKTRIVPVRNAFEIPDRSVDFLAVRSDDDSRFQSRHLRAARRGRIGFTRRRRVANRAVVVIGFLIVPDVQKSGEFRVHEMRRRDAGFFKRRRLRFRDYILMNVVRKSDRELPALIHFRKRESRFIARRNFRVADRADRRSRASEKLLAMAIQTRRVFRIIRNVWISVFFARKRFCA